MTAEREVTPDHCPNCSSRSVVLNKRGQLRLRQCTSCPTRWRTDEVIVLDSVGSAPQTGTKYRPVSKVRAYRKHHK